MSDTMHPNACSVCGKAIRGSYRVDGLGGRHCNHCWNDATAVRLKDALRVVNTYPVYAAAYALHAARALIAAHPDPRNGSIVADIDAWMVRTGNAVPDVPPSTGDAP